MYSWSALCRLWWAVNFARGTDYEEKAVAAFKAIEGLLDDVEAAALDKIYRPKRPPMLKRTDEINRAEILKEGWPSKPRPGLPKETEGPSE